MKTYNHKLCDLDKLLRKISIKFVQPYELYSIYDSFENIIHMINLLIKTNLKMDIYELFPKSTILEFNVDIWLFIVCIKLALEWNELLFNVFDNCILFNVSDFIL